MVYLVHSNSYDMNCFSFLSSNKESRTDVRLSLSCRPKKTSGLARDLHGAPDMVDAAVGQVKHIPFIKFNSNAGGKESLKFFEITQRIWKRQENARKAKKALCSEENGRVAC